APPTRRLCGALAAHSRLRGSPSISVSEQRAPGLAAVRIDRCILVGTIETDSAHRSCPHSVRQLTGPYCTANRASAYRGTPCPQRRFDGGHGNTGRHPAGKGFLDVSPRGGALVPLLAGAARRLRLARMGDCINRTWLRGCWRGERPFLERGRHGPVVPAGQRL